MINVPPFKPEKNKLSGKKFIILFELEYEPGLFVRYAEPYFATPITFEAVTWQPFPISGADSSQATSGEIPAFDIAFSNVGREVQSILEFYNVEGKTGRLVRIHPDMLADPTAKIDEPFVVVSARADSHTAVLTVAPVTFDPLGIQLPRELVTPEKFPGILGSRSRYLV